MRVFIASSNLGKIREIKEILQDSALKLLSILDKQILNDLKIIIPVDFDVLEDGETFRENAFLKAKAYANLTGLATIADDSGLEVEALGGFPSVNSNRWFEGSPTERNLALLDLLKDHENRRARFCGVVCFFDPHTGSEKFFEGEIRGEIAKELRGDKVEGFGYDPIFIPEGFTQTFSELGTTFKNSISHRRQALFKLSQYVLQDRHLERSE